MQEVIGTENHPAQNTNSILAEKTRCLPPLPLILSLRLACLPWVNFSLTWRHAWGLRGIHGEAVSSGGVLVGTGRRVDLVTSMGSSEDSRVKS